VSAFSQRPESEAH